MCATERAGRAAVGLMLVLVTACASLPAPREWVPPAQDVPQDARGAWVNVRHTENGVRVTTPGELIAISPDSIFVAMASLAMVPVARTDINRVQVVFFDPHESAAYGLGFAGAISTASHGWYAVFTFPIWLIVGAAGGSGRVGEAVVSYPREVEDWNDLRVYARFPQGLPRGFRPSKRTPVEPPPADAARVPDYRPAEKCGNGIVAGGGLFEDGKGVWTLGYHMRVRGELFALGGYTNLDDDVIDMEQWWAGLRVGDPMFIGARYIHTSHNDLPVPYRGETSGDGVSVFGGFLTPTSQHVGIGTMAGFDHTGLDYEEKSRFWWASVLLQLTIFPAE